MLIYQGELGTVEKGFFSGLRFKISTGHLVRATPWMKHQMGALNAELRKRGRDPIRDKALSAAFWDYFLDLAHSPANGLAHMAEAGLAIEEVADDLLAAADRG
jgi:hypothetical protein